MVVRKNDATNTWQRQFHYIDLELDGKLFLQTANGSKAMTDAEGCQVVSQADYESGGSSDKYVYAADCKSSSGKTHKTGDDYSQSDGGPYYVYIGSNRRSDEKIGTSLTGMRVYHNNDVDGNGTVNGEDIIVEYYDADGNLMDRTSDVGEYSGMRKFYPDNVYLVSQQRYNDAWTPQYDENGEAVPGKSGYDPVSEATTDISDKEYLYDKCLEYKNDQKFELLTLDPMVAGDTEVKVVTPYRTASAYWTKKVYFGYKAAGVQFDENGAFDAANSDKLEAGDLYDQIIPTAEYPTFKDHTNAYIAEHTAEVTLKHGYGLLFSSIPQNANYRFTEKLDDAEQESDYTLKSVQQICGENQDDIYIYEPGEIGKDGVYSVYGDAGIFEEQIHYTNEIYPKGSIAVEKFTGYGDLLEGAGFTLYEVDGDGNAVSDGFSSEEIMTVLMYMQPVTLPDEKYDAVAQIYTNEGTEYPVHKARDPDGTETFYYFRLLTDAERAAYANETLESMGLEQDRVRAVAEFTGLDITKQYKLKETTVPDGYIITHQPKEIFDFKSEDEDLILNMLYEVKNFNPLHLPDAGSFFTRLVALGALLSFMVLCLLRKRKRGKDPPG